jgi:hypothetical protein
MHFYLSSHALNTVIFSYRTVQESAVALHIGRVRPTLESHTAMKYIQAIHHHLSVICSHHNICVMYCMCDYLPQDTSVRDQQLADAVQVGI